MLTLGIVLLLGQGGWGGTRWRAGKGLLDVPPQLGQGLEKRRARKDLLVCQVRSQIALLLIPADTLQGKELISHFLPILVLHTQLLAAAWAKLVAQVALGTSSDGSCRKRQCVFLVFVLCGHCSQVAPVSCPTCGGRLCPSAICLRYVPFIYGEKLQTQTILSDLQKTVISTFPRHYGSILSRW